jgi:hypothetical protein
MSAVAVEKFEPIYLEFEGPARLTEYGKRWMDQRQSDMEKSMSVLRDVVKLGEYERQMWDEIQRILDEEGVPQNITSGVSQYGMSHLIDHINGKTSFTMPTTVAMALATTAPTSTTTGATLVEAAYTGYTREAIAAAGFNAATSATPSVSTNNGAITFPACTGSTSTLLGFMLADSSTLAAGNALWYGTLASVVISTTQTPPTVATTAMSLSMTGT